MRKIILCLLIAICAVCGAVGFAACVPEGLQPHNWSEEWNSDKETHWHDCLDQGCHAKGSRADHEWVLTDDIQIEPTCGEPGIGTYRCAVCGATVQNREIPPTEQHDWYEVGGRVEPTCNKEGSQTYACNGCDSMKTETLPATGAHNYDKTWHSDKEGHWHICTNEGCGEKSAIIPHEAGELKVVEPSGWDDGSETVSCKECRYKIFSRAIEPLGVPVSFEVTFVSRAGGNPISVSENENGLRVGLSPGRDEGWYYCNFVNFVDAEGRVVAATESDLNGRARIDVYWRNAYNATEEKLLDMNTSIEGYGYMNGGYAIRVKSNNYHKLVFKFITGSGSTENVRFEVVINVNG